MRVGKCASGRSTEASQHSEMDMSTRYTNLLAAMSVIIGYPIFWDLDCSSETWFSSQSTGTSSRTRLSFQNRNDNGKRISQWPSCLPHHTTRKMTDSVFKSQNFTGGTFCDLGAQSYSGVGTSGKKSKIVAFAAWVTQWCSLDTNLCCGKRPLMVEFIWHMHTLSESGHKSHGCGRWATTENDMFFASLFFSCQKRNFHATKI